MSKFDDFNSETDDPYALLASLQESKGNQKNEVAEKHFRLNESELEREYSLSEEIRNLVNTERSIHLPRDTRIDDSDLPHAKNIHDWATSENFMGNTSFVPFLEQLLWGVKLLSEECPRCTDMDWLYYDHKVDDTMQTFNRKVCMMEYGVCPSCGGRRSDFIKNGNLYFYNELAVCAGQRCVSGDTKVLTDEGLRKISDIVLEANGNQLIHGEWPCDVKLKIFDRQTEDFEPEYVKASKVYISEPEPLIRVYTKTGKSLRGRPDHPILTIAPNDMGYIWKKLRHISIMDEVVISNDDGTEAFHDRIINAVYTKPEYTFDFHVPEYHSFIGNGFINHNSGKSLTVGGIITPYITHKLIKMQKPTQVYRIASSTMLHATFCALTYVQAKDTLWQFFYGSILESHWYQEFFKLLDYYQEKYNTKLYKMNDTFMSIMCRNLSVYPAGPDVRILRGRTRFAGGTDEIGFFDNEAESKKIKVSARGVYEALDASLLTVRGAAERKLKEGMDDIINGMHLNVSSPSSQRDKIMELVRQAQDSETALGIHAPTWEVNPDLPRNSKVITEAYRKDPEMAERNYGANPPLSANPFISDHEMVMEAFGLHSNKAKINFKVRKETGLRKACRYAVAKVAKSRIPEVLAIDAGHSKNSFALVLASYDLESGTIKYNVLIEIPPKPEYKLNYTLLFDKVVVPLFQNRNIKLFLADRWNSLKLLSDVSEMYECMTQQYSLKYTDLWDTKTLLEQRNIVFPKLHDSLQDTLDKASSDDYPHCYKGKESDHLALQMLTVQDNGKGIIKGDGLTDDIWRAVCLANWATQQAEYQNLFMATEEEKAPAYALANSKLRTTSQGNSVGDSAGGATFEAMGILRSRK